MPQWTFREMWKGQEVFIIGGGPSLRKFNWSLLRDELTLGCNTAFRLGSEICKAIIFGDSSWWVKFKDELLEYDGLIFTNCPFLFRNPPSNVYTLPRESYGLHEKALGWNGNTGASAINLAFVLGAKTIYLLGFDMFRTEEHSNWHDVVINPNQVTPESYKGFLRHSVKWIQDWKEKFSDRQIINITNWSKLESIPKLPIEEFWSIRKLGKEKE